MRKQLKRQSAAHRDHLTDVLQTHAEKLAAEHKEELEQELRRQSLEHGSEMNEVMSHARGVGSMIDSVIDVEKKNRRMRDLWLAVQSLSSVLNEERSAGRTKNLLPEIGAIAKHSGDFRFFFGLSFRLLCICSLMCILFKRVFDKFSPHRVSSIFAASRRPKTVS